MKAYIYGCRPEAADIILENSRALVCIGGGRAFCSPGTDLISCPQSVAFNGPHEWTVTVLQELGALDRTQDQAESRLLRTVRFTRACSRGTAGRTGFGFRRRDAWIAADRRAENLVPFPVSQRESRGGRVSPHAGKTGQLPPQEGFKSLSLETPLCIPQSQSQNLPMKAKALNLNPPARTLDRTAAHAILTGETAMEIPLNPDLQAKLTRIAIARGSDAELIAREAIERFVDYDEWFLRQVDQGLDSANQGPLLTHDEVGQRLETQLARKLSSR